jgi:MtN3 and saliva related transmembrane protein
MSTTLLIGFLASFLITIAQIPQLLKIIKTKNTAGLSMTTCLVLLAGCLLWLVYGILMVDMPLIMCNSIVAVVMIVMSYYKFKYQ